MTSIRVAILTVSDLAARGERTDASGDRIVAWCGTHRFPLIHRAVVSDETSAIVPFLVRWADGEEVDLILTTGGTGFTGRDVTPEATHAVIERPAPGLAEALRRRGESSTPYAALSRGLAGVRHGTLIVNLPGSPGGVSDGLETLDRYLNHVIELLQNRPTSHAAPGVTESELPGGSVDGVSGPERLEG